MRLVRRSMWPMARIELLEVTWMRVVLRYCFAVSPGGVVSAEKQALLIDLIPNQSALRH